MGTPGSARAAPIPYPFPCINATRRASKAQERMQRASVGSARDKRSKVKHNVPIDVRSKFNALRAWSSRQAAQHSNQGEQTCCEGGVP